MIMKPWAVIRGSAEGATRVVEITSERSGAYYEVNPHDFRSSQTTTIHEDVLARFETEAEARTAHDRAEHAWVTTSSLVNELTHKLNSARAERTAAWKASFNSRATAE